MLKLAGYFFSGGSVLTPKEAKTFDQQLDILAGRGLEIECRVLALRHLTSANYFRLTGYRHPFLETGADTFRPGTTFAQLWELYRFDHRLRLLLMDAIERCEIAFRTRWAYELAHRYGPHAYENAGLHRVARIHASSLEKIDQEISRSHEDFLQPYRKGKISGRPPIWMICEVMSLGLLSNSCRNLKAAADRRAIAAPFGLDESVFTSFLHHLTLVRNFCAHHSRIWNRRFTITFQLPQTKPAALSSQLNKTADRLLYNTLALLAWCLDQIEPENAWASRVSELLDTAPLDAPAQMGFPANWRSLPIWSKHR
jgi:abortive infection bacteriophage resistance protein